MGGTTGRFPRFVPAVRENGAEQNAERSLPPARGHGPARRPAPRRLLAPLRSLPLKSVKVDRMNLPKSQYPSAASDPRGTSTVTRTGRRANRASTADRMPASRRRPHDGAEESPDDLRTVRVIECGSGPRVSSTPQSFRQFDHFSAIGVGQAVPGRRHTGEERRRRRLGINNRTGQTNRPFPRIPVASD